MSPGLSNMGVFDIKVFLIAGFINLVLTQNVDGNDQGRSARILYGNDARIENFPYYAGLSGCGAAILSKDWVVTAAHCVPNYGGHGRNTLWVGGETFDKSLRVVFDNVIMHPNAQFENGRIPQNDIALLHLTKPLKFSKKIKPIALPSGASTDSKLLFVGRGRDESGQLSKTLKWMEAVRLSSQECFSLLPREYQEWVKPQLGNLEKAIICAKRPENKAGVCNGDSGSPLVQKNTLVGLASFIGGMGCSEARLGFYVNVATYVPWIKSVTNIQ